MTRGKKAILVAVKSFASVCHTDHGDYDDKNPAKFNERADDLNFTKDGHNANINSCDNSPENGNPRSSWNSARPE